MTTAKITDANVTTAKIADSNVTTAKIADSNVTTAKIADSNVTTAKINNGAVTSAKLDTNIQIAGTLGVTGETTLTTHLNMGDSDIIKLGDSADLQIYHDGSNSYINDTGTGNLVLLATSFRLNNSADSQNMIVGTDNAEVSLFYAGSSKLNTKSDGVNITGELQSDSLDVDGATDISGQVNFHSNVVMDDNNKLIIGNGSDLQIYHDGSNSYIQDEGTGILSITTNGAAIELAKNGYEKMVRAEIDGAVSLYYDASTYATPKLATTSSGINVTSTDATISITGTRGTDSTHTISTGGTNSQNLNIVSAADFYRNATNHVFRDQAGTTEFMRIKSDGVGIGTASPTELLEVHGDTPRIKLRDTSAYSAGTGPEISFQGNDNTATIKEFGSIRGISRSSNNGELAFYTRLSGTVEERVRIDQSGNVGIGTDSPSNPLEVIGSADANIATFSTLGDGGGTSNRGLSIAADSYGGSIRTVGSSVSMGFDVNGSEAMRIDTNRTLIIGETTTSAVLNGTGVYINGGTSGSLYASATGTEHFFNRQEDGNILSFRVGGVNKGTIGTATTTLGTNPFIAGSAGRGLSFDVDTNIIFPCSSTGARADGSAILGHSTARFQDLYLSGGVYLGGTGSANLLDDYEEGSWTPSLDGSTGALTSITYVSRDGHYRKIGDTVIVWWDMQQTNISGGSGAIQIPLSDLPFAPSFSLSGGREIATGSAQTYLVPWPHDGTIGTRFEPSEGIQFQISRNNGTWSTITTANASGAGKYWAGHLIYRTTAT